MKSIFAVASAVLLAGLSSASSSSPYVSKCQAKYVDGHIFVYKGTGTDPPKGWPGKKVLDMKIYLYELNPAKEPWSALHFVTGDRNGYVMHKDVLYLDASPGAHAPVGFKNPKKLKGGETGAYWYIGYGVLLWTPTTNFNDGAAPGGIFTGGGIQEEPVKGNDGLYQLYWNQTLFEARHAGQTVYDNGAAWWPLCYPDPLGVVTDGGNL